MGDQKFVISSSLCFGKHVKPLFSAAFAVVHTHQSPLGSRGGLWPIFLMYNDDADDVDVHIRLYKTQISLIDFQP
jgi:hypothetical protein